MAVDFFHLMHQAEADRIVLSADHPYGSMLEARMSLDSLPIGPADREKIAHGNAERALFV